MTQSKKKSRFMEFLLIVSGLSLLIFGLVLLTAQRRGKRIELEQQRAQSALILADRIHHQIAEEFRQKLSPLSAREISGPNHLEPLIKQLRQIDEQEEALNYPFIVQLVENGPLLYPRGGLQRHIFAPKEEFAVTSLFMMFREWEERTGRFLLQKEREALLFGAWEQEFKVKHFPLALKGYREALGSSEDPVWTPFLIMRIAACLYKSGRPAAGRDQFNRLMQNIMAQLPPDLAFFTAFIHFSWARCELLSGDPGLAAEGYRRLLLVHARLAPLRTRNSLVFFVHEALDYLNRPHPRMFDTELEDLIIDLYSNSKNQMNTVQSPSEDQLLELYGLYSAPYGFYRLLKQVDYWEDRQPGIKQLQDYDRNKTITLFYRILQTSSPNKLLVGFQFTPSAYPIARRCLEINDGLAGDMGLIVTDKSTKPQQKEASIELNIPTFFPQNTLWVSSPLGIDQILNREFILIYAIFFLLLLLMTLFIAFLFRYLHHERTLLSQKTRFIEGASHTLKMPLARIALLSEVLSNHWQTDTEKEREFLETIVHESQRASDMIDTLLAVSGSDRQSVVYTMKPTSLADLVGAFMEGYAPYLEQMKFKTRINLESDIPLLPLDRTAMHIVLNNLLQNAVKYSAGERHIGIDLCQNENTVILSIEDKGPGISEPDKQRIFQRYIRGSAPSVRAIEGSGLGLWLVREMLQAHGARIDLESRSGQGSRFSLYFPIPKGDERCPLS